jgi:hypothetical protein
VPGAGAFSFSFIFVVFVHFRAQRRYRRKAVQIEAETDDKMISLRNDPEFFSGERRPWKIGVIYLLKEPCHPLQAICKFGGGSKYFKSGLLFKEWKQHTIFGKPMLNAGAVPSAKTYPKGTNARNRTGRFCFDRGRKLLKFRRFARVRVPDLHATREPRTTQT